MGIFEFFSELLHCHSFPREIVYLWMHEKAYNYGFQLKGCLESGILFRIDALLTSEGQRPIMSSC